MSTCRGCGMDYVKLLREKLTAGRSGDDEALHPWRYARDRGDAGLPF
jgi:hypothetical protein